MSDTPIYPPIDGACPRCVARDQEEVFCDVCGLRLKPGRWGAQPNADYASRQWEEAHPEWQQEWQQELAARETEAGQARQRAAAEFASTQRSAAEQTASPDASADESVGPVLASAALAFHCGTCARDTIWLPNGQLWCAHCSKGLEVSDTVEHTPTPAPAAVPPAPAATSGGGGFAFWNGETFVGFGTVGLVLLAILFFTHSGPFAKGGALSGEKCVVVALGGNKLCGDDARAWCDSTDGLRGMDATASAESQAVCDDIRR